MKQTKLIPLHRVPATLPKRRNGKRIHVSTTYRWTTRGIDGVKLQTVQVGNLRCTTIEMLEEFFARLASKKQPQPILPAKAGRRESPAAAKAKQALDAAGVVNTSSRQ